MNILCYRLCSFSFIVTFIDLWSFIPLVILFTINLCICGVFFIRSSGDQIVDTPVEEDHEELESSPVMTSPDYDTDSIGWNRNIVIMSPRKERPDTMVVDKPEDDIPHVSTTPSLVDEENTPILLNAVAGIFFPICHTQACTSHQMTEETLRQLLVWQNKFFQVQVLIFNTCILGEGS